MLGPNRNVGARDRAGSAREASFPFLYFPWLGGQGPECAGTASAGRAGSALAHIELRYGQRLSPRVCPPLRRRRRMRGGSGGGCRHAQSIQNRWKWAPPSLCPPESRWSVTVVGRENGDPHTSAHKRAWGGIKMPGAISIGHKSKLSRRLSSKSNLRRLLVCTVSRLTALHCLLEMHHANGHALPKTEKLGGSGS